MSSLMQFNGRVDSRGVHLQVYKVDGPNEEHMFFCPRCRGQHPRIFVFVRKPCGMFGCWVVFRYNGEENVPDLSCPFGLSKLPRDAKPLNLVESMKIWHS